ncbi:MAG: excisionase family DNA-binding protein [Terracidiphilus sp.]|nr:excisionase family DNA-binding protein [Terracidiphilus sp.]
MQIESPRRFAINARAFVYFDCAKWQLRFTAMHAAAHLISFIPSKDDVKLAREAKKFLALRLSLTSPFDLRAINPLKDPSIKIPAQAAHLLVQILDEMSRGNAVKLFPVNTELTTQEAADLLNVSRPTLIRLLNEGKIEFHKVGMHRRVLFKSGLAYKRQIDVERKSVLAELAAYDHDLGI